MIRLGDMLRRYRQHNDQLQTEMAEEIGITPSVLSSIERGHVPSAEAILKVQTFIFAVE